jgi:hypothetical protein
MKNVAVVNRGVGLRSLAVAMTAALVGSFGAVGSALAAGGMADGVVTTITSANSDVLLIGTAILALVVLIASIAWFKRATNK